MNILYLDLGMGAAGDMLCAALYELLDDDGKAAYIDKMNSLGLEGVTVRAISSSKCGICGTHMEVSVKGHVEGDHDHHHDHDHEHHHDHHGMDDISHVIGSMPLSGKVREDAAAVYGIIAKAESVVHDTDVKQIHFHEVGTADAIADVVGFCLLMEMLGIEKVIAGPVCVGFGKVKCAHGILPVPAPATANILSGIPMYAGDIEGELCTPTGAALVKYFVSQFASMPVITVKKCGYGMGTKDFKAANCVRALLGEVSGEGDRVVELKCNIDDMTGEDIGFATGVLMEEGALDVYTTAIGMKKSRPGVMLSVMCSPEDRDKMISLIFKHTTTIGVRENMFDRHILTRRTQTDDTSFGPVAVKISEGYGVKRIKYEDDDIRRIARDTGLSAGEIRTRLMTESDGDK